MRRELADFLRAVANFIHNDQGHEQVVITDEHGICRCRLGIKIDETHDIDDEQLNLPKGWSITTRRDR